MKVLLIIGVIIAIELVALLILKSQVNRYSAYWKNLSEQSAPEESITYVALGDSAAQGIGATSPERGYVGLIAKSLHKKTNKPVHIINLSKSGARIEDAISRQLPILETIDADVVTIEIGANDMQNFEVEKFRSEIETVISSLPKDAVVSNMPAFGGGRYYKLEPNVVEANKIIDELTQKYGLRMADLHHQIATNNYLNTYAADFFHPSNAGYKNWHNAFWNVLNLD